MTIAINEVVVPIALAIGRGVGGSHCHWWGWGAIGGGWGVPIAIDGGKVPITICIVGSGMPIVIGGGMPSDGAYSFNTIKYHIIFDDNTDNVYTLEYYVSYCITIFDTI